MHKHVAVWQAQQPSSTNSWFSRPIGVQRSCSTSGCRNQTVLPAGVTYCSVTHTTKASTRPTWRSVKHLCCCPSSIGSTQGRSAHLSAAAKGASMHPMNPPVGFSRHSATLRPFEQCMLLAVAAVGAAPALLLLDIAEQSVLGLGLMEMATQAAHPSRHQPAHHHHHHHHHHHQQQQQQQRPGQQQQQLPALPVGYAGRPLLPLWPPVLPMVLAVAPLGLLLWPGYRQTITVPLLLLGASLVVQAYINLVLVVCTRVSAHAAVTAAPAAWAATSTSTTPAPAAAAAARPTAAGGGALSAAAIRVFAWLQLLCDVVRVACCTCTAWLVVHAVSAGASTQWLRALQSAVQQFLGAGDLSVVVAAASAGAAALQHLVAVWWGAACIAALCSASAAVHALSLLAHCRYQSSRRSSGWCR